VCGVRMRRRRRYIFLELVRWLCSFGPKCTNGKGYKRYIHRTCAPFLFPLIFPSTYVRNEGKVWIWYDKRWFGLYEKRGMLVFFYGKLSSVQELVDTIKHVSLRWLLSKGIPFVCCEYEWVKYPLECLLR
jgi:hypothetical protein